VQTNKQQTKQRTSKEQFFVFCVKHDRRAARKRMCAKNNKTAWSLRHAEITISFISKNYKQRILLLQKR
jgi:hypothetical protein